MFPISENKGEFESKFRTLQNSYCCFGTCRIQPAWQVSSPHKKYSLSEGNAIEVLLSDKWFVLNCVLLYVRCKQTCMIKSLWQYRCVKLIIN